MIEAMSSRMMSWLVAAFVIAVVARVVLGILTWEPGWSALTWDDFTRVGVAQAWGDEPFWFYGFVWLPLPIWITGSIYALAGEWFTSNPMALMAIVNTTAIIIASVITAWSAHRIFSDGIGSLTAFILVLFAPWNYFLSLSGLAEPLYFVAIAVAVAGLVSWAASDKNSHLVVGSLGVAAAAGMRYEGWWLAAGWLAVIGVDSLLMAHRDSFRTALSERYGTLLIAGAPLVVPFAWMGVNLVEEGSPLYFARQSARIFTYAYGEMDRPVARIVYYPSALIRSAPLLLVLEAGVTLVRRHRRAVVLLAGLFTTQFLLFYLASLPSRALGAFPERFLFAFALGLAPLIGGLPGVLRDLVPARFLRPAAIGLIAIAVLVTGVRLQDRPEEWTHAPDLLALNQRIGEVAPDGKILVVAAPETVTDHMPIRVQNGDRVALTGTDDPSAVPGELGDVSFERSPRRILEFGILDAPAIGRYRLAGSIAEQFRLPPCTGCAGWTWVDESGTERPILGGPYLAFQFITADPLPGDRTAIETMITTSDQVRRGSVEFRGLWGHGFNGGRMSIVITLDDVLLHDSDISEPSRWTQVDFDVPPGVHPLRLSIAVVARDGIESGWDWGSASAVLVRSLVVDPA